MAGWQKTPFPIAVKTGDALAFCSCGLTKNAPHCDGSHVNSDKRPYRVKFEEDKTVFICGCQQSGKRPYCDGSHMKLNK